MQVGDTLSAVHGCGRFLVLNTGTARDLPNLNGQPLIAAVPLPCSAPRTQGSSPADLEPGARYMDAETGLELRCIEGATGVLRYADRPMARIPEKDHAGSGKCST
jgi:hypothetical protein